MLALAVAVELFCEDWSVPRGNVLLEIWLDLTGHPPDVRPFLNLPLEPVRR